ncbi:Fe-S-containing hydro-lyase [Ignatzschineria rhizosphaerae]|uniref:Fe-S-containing hydro-lyase n=1 Tax=Ignatzschineria rhizosphaerae TaxID=2923279 RepID=A0ABY3X217_9GAMM|nr:Fe-S-containing hydro-lyase [Ignatzschineria rhizosphaerae]UNM96928.1 Fe-S-containing hydro-lyase [Ignatzschineria rhizosphaerae]
MSEIKQIKLPLDSTMINGLQAGDIVHLSGTVYTGRDAAHKRMCEYLANGKALPINLQGEVIYYAGPCPPKPGEPIGSVGPTTASRMDAYSPQLIEAGLVAMIGKGARNESVVEAIKRHQGIYFAAIGGVAALMGKCVKSAEVIAFEDLGTEAIRRLIVENLPVIVAIDSSGNNLYQ